MAIDNESTYYDVGGIETIDIIKAKLNDETYKKLTPWYRNFHGEIKQIEKNKYMSYGKYELNEKDSEITITELPIGVWTDTYKENVLEKLVIDKSVDKKLQKKQFIKNYLNYSTDSKVNFVLVLTNTEFKKISKKTPDKIFSLLKLTSNINETNMYLFDKDLKIKKYNSTNEIIDEFYNVRLDFYNKRKEYIIKILEDMIKELWNKVRFIREVKSKKINILDISEEELNKKLETMKYDKINKTYEYLTTLAIRTLTHERANKLESEHKLKTEELNKIKKTTIKQMWLKDLDNVLLEAKKYDDVLSKEIQSEEVIKESSKKRKKKAIRKKK